MTTSNEELRFENVEVIFKEVDLDEENLSPCHAAIFPSEPMLECQCDQFHFFKD